MAYVEWDDRYSVKVGCIDKEHQKLVGMINDLHAAVMTRKGQDVLSPILSEMAQYAVDHFGTEEKLMAQYNYPQAAFHIKQHNEFVNKVRDFVEGFESGKLFLTTEVMDFLKNWLIDHIQGVDMQYSDFFNQHGIN